MQWLYYLFELISKRKKIFQNVFYCATNVWVFLCFNINFLRLQGATLNPARGQCCPGTPPKISQILLKLGLWHASYKIHRLLFVFTHNGRICRTGVAPPGQDLCFLVSPQPHLLGPLVGQPWGLSISRREHQHLTTPAPFFISNVQVKLWLQPENAMVIIVQSLQQQIFRNLSLVFLLFQKNSFSMGT